MPPSWPVDRLQVIVGEEVRSRDGDLIGLYLERAVEPGLSAVETAAAIHEQGGLVGLPHPFDGFRASGGSQARGASDRLDELAAIVDYVEAHNARAYRDANPQAAAFAARHALPAVASSDAHSVMEVGIASTVLPGPFTTAAELRALLPRAQIAAWARLLLRASLDAGGQARAAPARQPPPPCQPGVHARSAGPDDAPPGIRPDAAAPRATPASGDAPQMPADAGHRPGELPSAGDAAEHTTPLVAALEVAPSVDAEAVVDYPLVQEDLSAGAVPIGRRLRDRRTQASIIVPVLVLLLFVVALPGFQLDVLVSYVLSADPAWLLAAFVIYYLGFPMRGYRWSILLRGIGARVGVRDSTEIIFVSWLVNSVVPAKLGDVYRAWLLKINFPVSLSATFGTIFIERVFDLVAIVVLGLGAAFWSFRDGLSDTVRIIMGIGVVVVLGLAVALFTLRNFGQRLVHRLPLPARIVLLYERFEEGVFSVDRRQLPLVGLLTALIWTTEALRLLFVVDALGFDISLGISGAFFVALVASLLTAVPFTPAGLGIVEAGIVGPADGRLQGRPERGGRHRAGGPCHQRPLGHHPGLHRLPAVAQGEGASGDLRIAARDRRLRVAGLNPVAGSVLLVERAGRRDRCGRRPPGAPARSGRSGGSTGGACAAPGSTP